MATSTGGILNEINRVLQLSTRNKTVPVSDLIKAHEPGTPRALELLIADHRTPGCPCGLHSKGTVQEFGQTLYEAQLRPDAQVILKTANQPVQSLAECLRWCYCLYVTHSFNGHAMEVKAIDSAIKKLPHWMSVRSASQYEDFSLRIDILLHGRGKTSAIQVKPETYRFVPPDTRAIDAAANARFGHPVFYLFYDSSHEFPDADDVFARIAEHHEDASSPGK